jgi:hypothetical protein
MSRPCYDTFAAREAPYCLRVETQTQWVFPYAQLLHVEGTDEALEITLTTHDIVVRGKGLGVVLEGIAQHRIAAIRRGEAPGTSVISLEVTAAREDADVDDDTSAEQGLLDAIADLNQPKSP